jgi:beta-glucosidase-like glycosyl hydrolase
VVSDWGGTHSTRLAVEAGLDMEMSTAQYFTEEKFRAANVTESTINGMVHRILRSMFAAGLFERASEPGGEGSMSNDARSDSHRKLAADLAVAGTILLRNAGKFLPLVSSFSLSLSSAGQNGAAIDNQSPTSNSEPGAGANSDSSPGMTTTHATSYAVRIAVIGDEFTGALLPIHLSCCFVSGQIESLRENMVRQASVARMVRLDGRDGVPTIS